MADVGKGVAQFREKLQKTGLKEAPDWHVVLGSGFGASLDEAASENSGWSFQGEFSFAEIAGLCASTTPDHAGKFRLFKSGKTGKNILFQMGRLHGYEGHSAREAVLPVMISRMNGTQKFLLTNAAGGLDPAHRLGDVMLLTDHVNLTGQNPLSGTNPCFPDGKPLGPRFPDMSGLYHPEWRRTLKSSLTNEGVRVHEGVYLGLLGPSFETHAEVSLFGRWGIQAVGMSTVWEAIALKHSGARVGGLSLISNAAAGLGDGAALEHELILEACRRSAKQIVGGLLKWLESQS